MMVQGMVIYLMPNTENLSSIHGNHIWNNLQVCPLYRVDPSTYKTGIVQIHSYTHTNKEVHEKTLLNCILKFYSNVIHFLRYIIDLQNIA